MHTLILHPTAVSQWQALVLEAEQACEINLDTELESYLVFLLMRFLRHQDIADSILALEFLHSLDKHGQVRYNKLRDLGVPDIPNQDGLMPLDVYNQTYEYNNHYNHHNELLNE